MDALTIFRNTGAKFENVSAVAGLEKTTGWWYSLMGADVDNDGDMDYVAGNIGLNSRYQPGTDTPIEIFAADFDGNGSIDPPLRGGSEERDISYATVAKVFGQMPTLNRKFNEFVDFALASVEQVVDRQMLDTCFHRAAVMMESVVMSQRRKGHFTLRPLRHCPDLACPRHRSP
ncbi:MAG: VCBS repeat-containing protein [Ignavibacteria bacterium]|nr:VCBS repeat-containing protein [Ignavibacteria bacterium]